MTDRTVVKMLDGALIAFEQFIYRHGYGRISFSLGGLSCAVIGTFAVFGPSVVLIVLGAIALAGLLGTCLVAITNASRMRSGYRRLVDELQAYGKAIEALDPTHALVILSQVEEVQIDSDGTVHWTRTFTLGASSKLVPHYLRAGFSAERDDTDRERRVVRHEVQRVRPTSAGNGIDVLSTRSWTTSVDGHPMLVLHAYLGNDVAEGDTVSFIVSWPSASVALRRKHASEKFTLRFVERVHPSSFTVRISNLAARPAVNPIEGTQFTLRDDAKDWVIDFQADAPSLGDVIGVEVHLRR